MSLSSLAESNRSIEHVLIPSCVFEKWSLCGDTYAMTSFLSRPSDPGLRSCSLQLLVSSLVR